MTLWPNPRSPHDGSACVTPECESEPALQAVAVEVNTRRYSHPVKCCQNPDCQVTAARYALVQIGYDAYPTDETVTGEQFDAWLSAHPVQIITGENVVQVRPRSAARDADCIGGPHRATHEALAAKAGVSQRVPCCGDRVCQELAARGALIVAGVSIESIFPLNLESMTRAERDEWWVEHAIQIVCT